MHTQEILNRLDKLEKAIQSIENLKKLIINTNEEVWKFVERNTSEVNSLKQQQATT